MRTEFTLKDIERFWSNVDRSGGPEACWPWTGRRSRKGYGEFSFRTSKGLSRHRPASRVAWMITHGPIADGILICHRCDNPPCCNPAHLFAGDYGDNNRDCIRKGRGRGQFGDGDTRGENSYRAKLNEQQVAEIRQRFLDTDTSLRQMATEYRVSDRQMCAIVTGESWRHLPMPEPTVPPDIAALIARIRDRRGRPRNNHS